MSKLSYYFKRFVGEIQYFKKNLKYVTSNKKKAIYIGCTDLGNLGDEAILMATKGMLDRRLFIYDLSYASPSSGGFLRKFIVNRPDFIILGGGTLVKKGKDESYLKLMRQATKRWPKAKVIIFGPGVVNPDFASYIGFPLDKVAWKFLFNSSHFVSVRGLDSKMELDSWNLKTNVAVLHDPAIWFTRSVIKRKIQDKTIGLNFADIDNRIYGKNQNVIKEFALNLVKVLENEGWKIFLIPTTSSDLDFMMHDIGLKANKNVIVYKNYTSLDDTLSFLESLDVFLGQRLHSIIFSASVFTPFIALEYEPKTSDFLSTIHMMDYKIRVDKLHVDTAVRMINKIYKNLFREQSTLHKKMTKAKSEQVGCLNSFLKTLKS